MFDFIRSIQRSNEQKAKQTATQADRYRELVLKGGTDAKLSKPETDELAGLAESLGINPERIEAEVIAVAEYAKLKSVAARLDAATRAHVDAKSAVDRHTLETNTLIRELTMARAKELADLGATVEAHQSDISAAKIAANKIDAIERKHWSLFGRENPQEAQAAEAEQRATSAKTRFVLRRTPENLRRYSDNPRVFWFETLLHSAGGLGRFTGFETFNFETKDDQPQAELAEILRVLGIASLNPSGHRVRFLLSREQAAKHNGIIADSLTRDLTLWAEEFGTVNNPAMFTFVPLVGQSPAELKQLTSKLAADFADAQKRREKPAAVGNLSLA